MDFFDFCDYKWWGRLSHTHTHTLCFRGCGFCRCWMSAHSFAWLHSLRSFTLRAFTPESCRNTSAEASWINVLLQWQGLLSRCTRAPSSAETKGQQLNMTYRKDPHFTSDHLNATQQGVLTSLQWIICGSPKNREIGRELLQFSDLWCQLSLYQKLYLFCLTPLCYYLTHTHTHLKEHSTFFGNRLIFQLPKS